MELASSCDVLGSSASCYRYSCSDPIQNNLRFGRNHEHLRSQRLFDLQIQRSLRGRARRIIRSVEDCTLQNPIINCRRNGSRQELAQMSSWSIASLLQRTVTLVDGEGIHAHLIERGLDQDTILANHLLMMYARCGAMLDARSVFDNIRNRNVITWTAMIGAYANQGNGSEALRVFQQMQREGEKPNKVTFICLLSACSSLAALKEGKLIHESIVDRGFQSDVTLGAALINMYAKCAALDEARSVFDTMYPRNVVSWTAIIMAYAQQGYDKEALQLFQQMQHDGVRPDKGTYITILSACAQPAALGDGRMIHGCIADEGYQSDVAVGTALINMYGKCNALVEARAAFERIYQRDVVSWNSLLSAYTQQGHARDAILLFQRMQLEGVKPTKVTFINMLTACASLGALEEGKLVHACVVEGAYLPDDVVATALVSMYGKFGALEEARYVFDTMYQHDVVSWTALITAYTQQGHNKEALHLFEQMLNEGVKPNEVTFTNILSACASLAALGTGTMIHSRTVDGGLHLHPVVGNGLINMYGKCGALADAHLVLNKMNNRDVVSWNAMIMSYSQQGDKEALVIFQQMQQEDVKPDELTFLSLLSACSHAGLVEEAHQFLHMMNKDHGLKPWVEHYVCIIDLLGRTGQLVEAEDLIYKTPQPDARLWIALLAACRIHGDAERALHAAEQVFDMDPQNSAPYVLLYRSDEITNILGNICSADGRLDDLKEMTESMEEKEVEDQSGIHSIKAHCSTLQFPVRERLPLQREVICA